MKNFLLGACSVVLLLTVLLLAGFKFIYAPYLENKWEAVSAGSELLGVLISGVLTGIIIYQTNKIDKSSKNEARLLAEKQLSFEKHIAESEQYLRRLELRIELYDKRYVIYERINTYLDRIETAIKASKKPLPDGSYFSSKDLIFESVIKFERRSSVKNRIAKLNNEIQKAGTKEKAERLTSERNALITDLEIEKIEFIANDYTVIKQAEFCYPKELAQPIIQYFDKLFDWYFPTTKITEDDILNELRDLKNKNIIESMKSLLTLSYEDVT